MLKRHRNLLVIAFLIAIIATFLASLLLVSDVVNADRQAFQYIDSGENPNLANVLQMFTVLGSLEFGLLWFVGLWLMKRSDLAAYVLVAIVLEILIITFMKDTILRPRPDDAIMNIGLLYSEGGWSFPSGHAAGAFALCTVIGLKVRRVLPLMVVIALLVAFSRVYIGVHYPLDVIAGSLIGILIGLFAVNLDLRRFVSLLIRGRDYLGTRLGRVTP